MVSVSKKPEKLSAAAAAIFVITPEDLRRSGATSIPEALRMVPGLQVARINASTWAITSRGFSGSFANKLLVLIDGRTVYSPLYSGVFWNIQDMVLEDVERIEVIRGPGATLWGANAANGIINIITKSAKDTPGGLVSAGVGTEERGIGAARYGVNFREDAHLRVYAKYVDRDEGGDMLDRRVNDDWRMLRGGFRLDWQASGHDAVTCQGDIYDGQSGVTRTAAILVSPFEEFLEGDTLNRGGNLLTRWEHVLEGGSEFAMRIYYDRTELRDPLIGEDRDTVDIDFQHQFSWGKRQEVVWGLGYRYTRDDVSETRTIKFDPDSQGLDLFSAFLQDQIMLVDDRLWLTLGSKFEHNDFTGFEIQPSARLMWQPQPRHTLWAAISRAVRTPSRAESTGQFDQLTIPLPPPATFPVLIQIQGDGNFASEDLTAFEIGYRTRLMDRLSLDLAAFYNDYTNLISDRMEDPRFQWRPTPHLLIPIHLANEDGANTYGLEAITNWQVRAWWKLQAAYTFLQIDRDVEPGNLEGSSPHHQFSLRCLLDLPRQWEVDSWLRYVDALPSMDLDGYLTLDVRLGWKPMKNLELSLVGQNLLDDRHPEFIPFSFRTVPTEVERSVYGKITWRF